MEPTAEPFSDELERWSTEPEPRTFGSLGEVFGRRGIAVLVLLLMALPATPLPTGGLTHLFEAVAFLAAMQLVLGRERLWLPRSWRARALGKGMLDNAVPWVIRVVRWGERHSRGWGASWFAHRSADRLLGLVLLVFIAAAAIAPPFSGLDTLPALGAVLIALAILLEEGVLVVAGVLVGAGGIALIATLGAAAVHLVRSLL